MIDLQGEAHSTIRARSELHLADVGGGSAAANGEGSQAETDNSIVLKTVAVNVSVLSNAVTNNSTLVNAAGDKTENVTGNDIGSAFEAASGVNVAAQNAGQNSLVDQNVNVQANISSGDAQ